MNLKTYSNQYTFDKGLNLLERYSVGAQARMVPAFKSNKAVNVKLYNSLKLTPSQKLNLNDTFLTHNIFDKGGNQLTSFMNNSLEWDYRNMLQTTLTDITNELGVVAGKLKEYNLYSKTGKRNRKITEKTDAGGSIVEIQEALYLGNLEYRSIWVGNNLNYDGETIKENGHNQSPQEAYVALRIRQGHKQVSEKRTYTFKEGRLVSEMANFFSLDNNIDSCELQLNNEGNLESYYASKPYGETAVSYGRGKLHPYKYSGQEKDQSGLYYYGYRSLLPQNFRWMSVDPAGLQGSSLNWYAMVNGNPVMMRDMGGLLGLDEVLAQEGLQGHLLLYGGNHNANKKHLPLIRNHIPRKILLKEHNASEYRALAWVGYDRTHQKPLLANNYNQLEVTAIQGFLAEIKRVTVPNEVVGIISNYISEKETPLAFEYLAFDVNQEAFVGHTSNHRINGQEFETANVALRSYHDYNLVQNTLNENPNLTHNRAKDSYWIDNILKPLGIEDTTNLVGPENVVALVGPGHPFPMNRVKAKGLSHQIPGFIQFQDPRESTTLKSLEHESSFNLVNRLNAVGILPMDPQADNPSNTSILLRMQTVKYIKQRYNYRDYVNINGVGHIVFWKRDNIGVNGANARQGQAAPNHDPGCCKIL